MTSVEDEADKPYDFQPRTNASSHLPERVPSAHSSFMSRPSTASEEEHAVGARPQHAWAAVERPRVSGSTYWGTHYDLQPLLIRRHILMISVSGTIGMGLFVTTGQVIKIAGSAGALLSYALTGLIIHAVMRCIGEMVALIPESGAIMEYPMRFVDDALGWTVAVVYWFTYAMGVTTLTTSTAILASFWDHDVPVAWIITAVLALVIIINVFGIKVFGEIEYASGMLKVTLVAALVILMFAINRGTGFSGPNPRANECDILGGNTGGNPREGKVHGVEYWTAPYRFTPYFAGVPELSGSLGNFLSVWKGMTLVAFSYIGVEIVAVAASEAKYPRDDLPPASRRIFWTTFTLYAAAVFSVSLNVPHTDCFLQDIFHNTRAPTGQVSPFIIAIKNAGIDFLPGFVNAALLFATWSTTNTELYVASRTLYGMAARLDPETHPYLSIFGRTTKNGVPMTAIFASCSLAPLAYLQVNKSDPSTLLSIFSQISTVGCLIVWMCQCIAFIRFYNGLQIRGAPHNRLSSDYPYASSFQPWSAYFGAVGCGLLIFFNGFEVFIPKIWENPEDPDSKAAFKTDLFLAAYLGVFLAGAIYVILKLVMGGPFVTKEMMEYGVRREKFDMRRPPQVRSMFWRIVGWVFE